MPRILLVEDDDGVRYEVAELFRELGYDVRERTDGADALAYLMERTAPDLIVLDLRLPRMDGWEFRLRQKGDARIAHIPVVAISADPSPQASAIDADYFLRKPFDSEELLRAVSEIAFEVERRQTQLLARNEDRHGGVSPGPEGRAVVVSADRHWRRGIRSRLAAEGFEVEVTAHLDVALANAVAWQPDVVVAHFPEERDDDLSSVREQMVRTFASTPILTVRGEATVGAEVVLDVAGRQRAVSLAEGGPAAVGVAAALEALRWIRTRLRQQNQSLHVEATADELTGVYNRRFLRAQLGLELSRASRFGTGYALLLLDIDRLKAVNDAHGHTAGDRVLVAVASVLVRNLRTVDTVARFGGDEFAILLPHADERLGEAVGSRLCREVHEIALPLVDGGVLEVSCSIGCTGSPTADGVSVEQALRLADRALYAAKRQGRDQVVVADRRPLGPGSAAG